MKTLRRIVAVALLLGSYHVGMAQSNSVPTFKSDTEKQAWIDANPEIYKEALGVVENDQELKVLNSLKFSSDPEKQAWIESNPALHKKMLDLGKSEAPLKATQRHENVERFNSEEEKRAWLEKNNK